MLYLASPLRLESIEERLLTEEQEIVPAVFGGAFPDIVHESAS